MKKIITILFPVAISLSFASTSWSSSSEIKVFADCRADLYAVLIAVIALAVAVWSAYASHRQMQIQTMEMYKDINEYVINYHHFLGPLTPYKAEPDEEALRIRQFYLLRFNRFLQSTFPWDQCRNIHFRNSTMGNSLDEFYEMVQKRNGSDEYARKAVRILQSIKENEPYYNDKLWSTYFEGYNWTFHDH